MPKELLIKDKEDLRKKLKEGIQDTDAGKVCSIEETFYGNGEITPFGATKPKGAIVLTVEKIEEYK